MVACVERDLFERQRYRCVQAGIAVPLVIPDGGIPVMCATCGRHILTVAAVQARVRWAEEWLERGPQREHP
jgi:hypothetical protein